MRKDLQVFSCISVSKMCTYLTFPTCNSLNGVPLCCGFLSCRLRYVPVCYSKYTVMVPGLQVRKSQCSGMAHAGLHMHVHHLACNCDLSCQVPQGIPVPILYKLNKYTNSLPVGIGCSVCSQHTHLSFWFVLSSP